MISCGGADHYLLSSQTTMTCTFRYKISLFRPISVDITQCKRDRILARDPRLRLEFLPRCDADGSYHVIQCSVHLDKCWCVDQSGHKIADAYDGHKGKYCGRKKTKGKRLASLE